MRLKETLLYLACLTILVVTTSTAALVGINSVGTVSYGLFIILFISKLLFDRTQIISERNKIEGVMILIFVLYSIFQFFAQHIETIQPAFFFLVVPMLISMVMKIQSTRVKSNVGYILIGFYIIQCTLAIFEKMYGVNVFPYREEIENPYIQREDWQFRSTGLLGHPLNNALCTSILFGFIMVSRLRPVIKITLAMIGVFAILSFNARGATIILVVLLIYYLFILFKKFRRNISFQISFPILLCAGIVSGLYILSNTSFGGRIFNEDKLIDNSAQTRLDVLNAFEYINGYDLIIGNPDLYMSITQSLNAAGVENSLVVVIIRYGVLFGIPIISVLALFVYKNICMYILRKKFVLLSSFILIGLLNNSLAGSMPWVFFILCVNSFSFISSEVVDRTGRYLIASGKYGSKTLKSNLS